MSKEFNEKFNKQIDDEVNAILFERRIQKDRKIIFDFVKHLFNTCDHPYDLIHDDSDLKEEIEAFLKNT